MKNINRKKIIKELDLIFSKIVKKKGKCFCCGSTNNLTCGHLITRSIYNTRWDLNNAECQCVSCNLKHEYRPEIFTKIYIEKYGLEKYQNLVKKSKETKKISNTELEKLLIELKKQLNE